MIPRTGPSASHSHGNLLLPSSTKKTCIQTHRIIIGDAQAHGRHATTIAPFHAFPRTAFHIWHVRASSRRRLIAATTRATCSFRLLHPCMPGNS